MCSWYKSPSFLCIIILVNTMKIIVIFLLLTNNNDLDSSWSWCRWVSWVNTVYYRFIQTNANWVNRQCGDQRCSSLNLEVLKVNVVEFTTIGIVWLEGALAIINMVISSSLPRSLTSIKLHCKNSRDVYMLAEVSPQHDTLVLSLQEIIMVSIPVII